MDSLAVSLNTTIRIFEVTYQLKAVDEQTTDLLETTRHVNRNISEARRLRRIKAALLNHGECTWIDGVIDDTENALRAVAQLIEPARIDKTTKQGISIGSKVMWIFRDSPKVRDKHIRLSMCHQSLSSVITCLYSKDVVAVAPLPEEKPQERPPSYDPQMEQLFNWRNRRIRAKSSSLSNVKVEVRPKSAGLTPTNTDSNSPISQCAYSSSIAEATESAGKLADNPLDPFSSHTTSAVQRTGLPAWDARNDATASTKKPLLSSTTDLASVSAIHQSKEPFNIRQRQMNEEAANSRLPYPMSPSDYSTISAADSGLGSYDVRLDSASSSSIPQVPGFREQMPTPEHGMDPLGIHFAARPDLAQNGPPLGPPGSMSMPTGIEDSFSFSSPSHNSFDGADGLQVMTEPTRRDYRHHTDLSLPPLYFQTSSSWHSLPTTSPHSAKHGPTPEPPRDLSSPQPDTIAELGATDYTNSIEVQGYPSPQPDSPIAHQAGSSQGPRRDSSSASGQGGVRRGGRSWLMFHASRSDLGHYGG